MAEKMMKTVVWLSLEDPGAEYVTLWQLPDGYRAQGRMAGVYEGQPARASYRLELDAGWRVRRLAAAWVAPDATHRLRLHRDAAGAWHDQNGPRPDLAGCVDVDMVWTPLTNTLPIRRLGLAAGEHREISVAYITPPALTVAPDGQRYTRLGPYRWRFDSLDSAFTAEITVDGDGLVIDYSTLFRRAGSWETDH
jgi:uncharacterized protein